MKVKLYTKATKNLISKLITKLIYKNSGLDTKIQMNDLDIEVDGEEIIIKANAEIKLDKQEFMDFVRMYC
jgi:hypothetical protein